MRSVFTSGLKRVSVWAPLLWSLACGGKLETTSCREGGRDHSLGESWDCADGCNTCICDEDGVTTTRNACDVDISMGANADAGSTSTEASESTTDGTDEDTNDDTDVSPDDIDNVDELPDDVDQFTDDTDVTPDDTDVSPNDGSTFACQPHVRILETPLIDESGGKLYPAWLWTERGLVGLRSIVEGHGLELWHADDSGATLGGAMMWPGDLVASPLHLASVGNSVAVAQSVLDENGRSTCQLAVVGIDPFASLLEPRLVSDAANAGTILNESQTCTVVALDDGFVVVWDQYTSDTSDEQTLFAQRVDEQGTYLGQRWTIAVGDKGVVPQVVASNGQRVLIGLYAFSDAQEFYALTSDGAQPLTIDQRLIAAGGIEALVSVGEDFMAFTRDGAYQVSPDGKAQSDAVTASSGDVAALGDNIVLVQQEEFLPLRIWDPNSGQSSTTTNLSSDRLTSSATLIASPAGDEVAVFFSEDGKPRLAFVECGSEATPSSARACALQEPLVPLEDGCTEAVCHTVIRLDSIDLALRGWSTIGNETTATDAAMATAIAEPIFAEFNTYGSDIDVTGPHAGVYYTSQQPLDFGGFALVGALSGKVITAGGIVWSGAGNYWLPDAWQSAGALACSSEPVAAEEMVALDQDCDDGDSTLPTAQDALDLVLRTNLAADIAQHGKFSAFSTLYTRAVGSCSRTYAEFIVVLTRS